MRLRMVGAEQMQVVTGSADLTAKALRRLPEQSLCKKGAIQPLSNRQTAAVDHLSEHKTGVHAGNALNAGDLVE